MHMNSICTCIFAMIKCHTHKKKLEKHLSNSNNHQILGYISVCGANFILWFRENRDDLDGMHEFLTFFTNKTAQLCLITLTDFNSKANR